MSHEALLDIQRLDVETDRLNHRRINMEERRLLEEAQAQQQSQQEKIDAVAAARVEVATRQRRFEDEAQILSGRADADDARLYSGEVQGVKELEALQHEIAGLRSRQRAMEDEALEAMEEAESLASQVEEFGAEGADVDHRVESLIAAIATAETQIDNDVDAASAARSEAVEKLAPELVARYESLRPGLGSATVVSFNGSNCSGCPSVMPAVEADRVKHEASGSVLECGECGRMVLR